MHLRDQLSGLFGLGIALLIVCGGVPVRGSIGTLHYPGAGFLPFWSAVGLGVLSIILVFKSTLAKRGEEEVNDQRTGKKWRKALWLVISLFIYAIVLPRLGYLIATFGIMTYQFGLMGQTRIWIQAIGGAITALLSYLIFQVWLQCQLPAGIFGF